MSVVAPMKLVVDGVGKRFSTGKDDVVALAGVDLHVDDGELVCLLGSSGCGKSTLLNMIGGLEDATSGEIRVDGALVVGPGADRGMVFQGYSLFPWLSVARNVEFGLELIRPKLAKAARQERVHELLGIMHLTEYADRLPRELSGGMRQRVAIARALALEPELLLMDEPFAALDAQRRELLQEELLAIWQADRRTVLFVTHSLEEAIVLGDRVAVMSARPGRLLRSVDVPFDRPRTSDLRAAPEFGALKAELWEMLRGEVIVAEPAEATG
jgi:NitT/TauT family transport system ATP-binding protein